MRHSISSCLVLLLLGPTAFTACERDRPEPGEARERAAEPRPAPTPAPAVPQLPSEEVERAVRSALEGDRSVSSRNIQVRYSNGVAELIGTTRDLLSKERAAKRAQTVRGVLSVSNRIVVDVPSVPDAQLAKDLESALAFDATTDALEVEATARDGAVTLTGAVDSWVEKDTAELVAKGVRGVRSVDNRIIVEYSGKRSDAEIRSDVEARLRWDALVQSGPIGVRVEGGIVSLSGMVGSAAERDRAYRLAGWVLGARAVRTDDLAVRWWIKDEDLRVPERGKPRDREIADAIRAAALVDPRVKSYELQPVVSGGFVTLRGRVDNPRARLAAESIARNTVGVIDVKNEMSVAPSKPLSDTALRDRARAALKRDAITESQQVEIKVKAGVVTLSGSVETQFERAHAEDVVARLRNVIEVKNEIDVRHPEQAYVFDPYADRYSPMVSVWRYVPLTTARTDQEIRDEIVAEMTWSPFVDADQVNVTVANGKATLTGDVDTMAERRAATENAFEGGALFVDNQLKIAGG